MTTTTSLEEMQARRHSWVPRWMYSVPDIWGAFGDEHPLKVEQFRNGDQLVVRAELPGIDPERDVQITIEDGVLCVRGERRMHRDAADRDRFRSEFTYGAFVRRMPVPASTAEEDVKATYDDGILEVRIPIDGDEPPTTRVPISRR